MTRGIAGSQVTLWRVETVHSCTKIAIGRFYILVVIHAVHVPPPNYVKQRHLCDI